LNETSNSRAMGAPIGGTANPRRQEVESAIIGHLLANIATPLITSTVVALFVLYVMWEVVAPAWLGAWFVAVVLMNGGRYLLLVQARRAPPQGAEARRLAHKYTATVAVAGALWGVAGGVFFPLESVQHQVFLAFIIGGLVAGSMASYAIWLPVFHVFTVAAMVPIVVRFLAIGEEISVLMGLILTIYVAALTVLAGNVNRSLRQSVELQFENAGLVADLTRSQEQYDLALKGTNDGIWDWDIDRDEIYFSPRMLEIFGSLVGLADLLDSKTIRRMIHPDDRDQYDEEMQKHLRGETDYFYLEHRLQGAESGVRWVVTRGVAQRDAAGVAHRMAGSATDITERKLHDEALRRGQKMEALGNLAGGIAHNLNNLLLPILSLSDMTARAMPAGSEERENMDVVVSATESAKKLVERVMAFGHMDEAHRQTVDIGTVVGKTLELLPTMVPSSVRTLIDLDENVGEVRAEVEQIETVVLNLIFNAVDAIHGKAGRIDIGLKRIEVGEAIGETMPGLNPGFYAQLTILDNGPGMDEATQDRIFDPFFTTKEEGEGTGLGLSSAHGIVDSHGGVITVESMVDWGSKFNVFLPLVETGSTSSTAADD
jgi:PAS domain S-box-containing protein